MPVVAVVGEAREVAEHHPGGVPAGPIRSGLHQIGHRRPQAVGPDDDPGADAPETSLGILDDDTVHPTVGRAGEVHQPGTVDDLGPGLARPVHEHPIEHAAPRGVQPLDSLTGLDRDPDHLVGVVEGRRAHDGGPLRLDGLEEAPPVELQHRPPHEGMGRKCVGAIATPVDDQDSQALAGEEHAGGRTCTACAHDDGVVPGMPRGIRAHDLFPSLRRPRGAGARRCGQPGRGRRRPRRR